MIIMKRILLTYLTVCITSLLCCSLYAADIKFNSSSVINGSGVMLYFDGYGSTYTKDKSPYTVEVESDNMSITSINVQDAAGAYLYCTMNAAPISGQTTTVTLTYSNGDCGKVTFEGTMFKSTSTCAPPVSWDCTTPIEISSVTCSALYSESVVLTPVVQSGMPAKLQVSYGTKVSEFELVDGSVTVTGLSPLTSYTFTVRGVDGCGHVSTSAAAVSGTTSYAPHGGADSEDFLTETEFVTTSTGTCATSIAGGTSFSQYGSTDAYNHTIDEIDVIGELTINSSFTEAYSNGYFHESGVSDGENHYAIVSNPKVLNGTYSRKSDNKNRLVMALANDPNGAVTNLIQFKRKNLAAGSVNVSFTLEDLVGQDICPQGNLPTFRQFVIKVYVNGVPMSNEYPNVKIGDSYTYKWSGTVSDGDVLTVDIAARFMDKCTAVAISDLVVNGCLNRAIETTTGSTVFCEDSNVTLMANGTSATVYKWESSPDATTWTTMPATGKTVTVKASLGNTYYRFTEQGGITPSKVFNLLGQVCCTYLDEQKSVWKETFGNSTGRWTNPNVKNHQFQPSPSKIDDGYYAVVSNSSDANQSLDWPSDKRDHTGDANGGFLVINVGNQTPPPVLIYSQTITPNDGFCESTYYNLSLFASNISPGGLPSSFEFEVVDATTHKMLGKGNTGDINDFAMSNWLNFGTSFAPENSTSVIINIYNTGVAGGGNDVVLDDISVSVCNAKIELYANGSQEAVTTQCGKSVALEAVADGNLITYFGTDKPYYLWAKSIDGGSTWSVVEAASGDGKSSYNAITVSGESALYKVVIAKIESDARKVLSGTAIGGCVVYTITNEIAVECTGCDTPKVEISGDETKCANSASMPTFTATITEGRVAKYIWKSKLQGSSDYTTIATHISTATTDSYTPAAMPTGTTIYMVTALSDDGCESSVEHILTILEAPEAPITEDISECYSSSGTYTFTATASTGCTLVWYDSESGGTELSSAPEVSLSATGTHTYYVSQRCGECESPRASVTLTIGAEVMQPEVKYRSACINGAQIEYDAKPATGYELVWYLSKEGATPESSRPKPDMSVGGKQSVYVSQKMSSNPFCEGERVNVDVTIYETLLTVTSQPLSVCLPSKVDLTTATISPSESESSGTFKYYYSDQTTEVPDPHNVSAGTYYVQLTENGCPSDPETLTAVTNRCDNLTLSVSAGTTVCEGDEVEVTFTLANMSAVAATGVKVVINEDMITSEANIKSVDAGSGTSYSDCSSYPCAGGVWSVGDVLATQGSSVELKFTIEALSTFDIDAFVSEVNTTPYTKSEAKALTDKTYYAKSTVTVKPYADSPVVENFVGCAPSSHTIKPVNEFVTANKDNLKWYEKSDAGDYVEIPSFDVTLSDPQDSYYYVTNTTSATCESDVTELHILSKENAKFVGSAVTRCSDDLKKYSVEIEVTGGTLTADYAGAVISSSGNVWTVSEIDKSTGVKLTVELDGCGSFISVEAPECNCPDMDAPQPLKSEYAYCSGDAIPSLDVTIASEANLVANWYDSERSTTILSTGLSYTPSAPGTYYVECYNTLTECSSERVAVKLVENANPTADITASDTKLTCTVTEITLSATPETGVDYLWSDAASSVTGEISVATAATYTVEVTDQTTQCKGSASIEITEDVEAPALTLSTTDDNVKIDCAVTSIDITANATPTDRVTYLWNTGETTSTVTASDAGLFSVEVTNSDNGCTATDNVTIDKESDLPSVNITASDVEFTCEVLQITLTAVTENTIGKVTYLWSDGSTGSTLDITSKGNYSVTITDEKPCSASGNVSVNENKEAPDVDLTASAKVFTCNVSEITLRATDGFASYSWYRSDGSKVTPQSGDAANECTVTDADTYTVTAKNGANGCLSSKDITLTEDKQEPSVSVASAGGITVIDCNNRSITLTAEAENCTYQWSAPDGSTIATQSDVTVTEAGTYTIAVTDVENGCKATDDIEITSDMEKPEVTISASPSTILTCKESSITLTASADNCTLYWNGIGSDDESITVTQPATYIVEATSLSNGCKGTATQEITQSISYPSVKVNTPHYLCYPETYDVNDAIVYSLCDKINLYSDAALTEPLTESLVSELGVTTVYIQGVNLDGCVSEVQSVEVTVSELEFDLSPDNSVCSGSSTTITATGTGSQASDYKFELTKSGAVVESATGSKLSATVQPLSKSDYIVTASNGACISKKSVTVDVLPLPVTNYERTGVYSFDVIQVSQGASPYKYSLDGVVEQSETSFTVDAFGSYTVYVTDNNGCKSSMDVMLEKVVTPIEIPSFFSPNGDGVNDRWEIKNIEYYPDAIIEIYDRYHKLLVRYRGCDAGWDGEYNGHAMPTTDYWYYIRDSELQIISGHFLLKR